MTGKLTAWRTYEDLFAMHHEGWCDEGSFDVQGFVNELKRVPGPLAKRIREYAIWYAEEMAVLEDWYEEYVEEVFAESIRRNTLSYGTHYAKALVQLNLSTTIAPAEARSRLLGKARKSFEDALQLRPRSAEALYGMGCAIYEDVARKPDDARPWFSMALEVCPNMAVARLLLGNSAQDAGRFGDALAEYDKVDSDMIAQQIAPWRATSMLLNRAYCLWKTGRDDAARTVLSDVLARYEAAVPGDLPDELFSYPNMLVKAVSEGFSDSLGGRLARCIRRYGWEDYYRSELTAMETTGSRLD